MPELSRFYGVIIRMYMETGTPHHLAHFHAYYQNEAAILGIKPVELISGTLPRKQLRLVEAWAELHVEELSRNWNLLQEGKLPTPINPLN